jgi:hypothetical protein
MADRNQGTIKMKPNTYQRRRSAVATKAVIDSIPAHAREQRARHATAREHGQRLAAAQSALLTAETEHEHALARVPETAAAVEAAKAALAAIEAEPAFVNYLMAG